MSVRIRVFVVDDHEVVRRGILELLSPEDDLLVVGEASSVEEALTRIPACRPDVAVLDIRLGLGDADGIELWRDLRDRHPEIACVMFTGYPSVKSLAAAVMAGANAYIVKAASGGDLVNAIKRVAAGESLLDAAMTNRLLDAAMTTRLLDRLRAPTGTDPLAALTPQQLRVLALISEGQTNKQIAETLTLSPFTVKNYVSNLLAVLGMARRSEAAALSARTDAERRRRPPDTYI